MNEKLLHKEVQQFINDHLNANLPQLILKGSPFNDIDIRDLAQQISAKSKCKKKLPTWFNTENIYYPSPLNIEQTSSELTAQYKASLVQGDSLIDLTGGYGVDSFFFSRNIKTVSHCELDGNLAPIAHHNFKVLGAKNILSIHTDGIVYLKNHNKTFDWIYIDPSRRDAHKSKVFKLEDCLPDVGSHLDLFLERAERVMIKVSPLLDLSLTIKDLKFVKEVQIVAVHNEVKELLIFIEKGYVNKVMLRAVNLNKKANEVFEGYHPSQARPSFSKPEKFLYEPNAAVLKSGLFNEVSEKLNVSKLQVNSHLYTSKEQIDFPGRSFVIKAVSKYNKKLLKKEFNYTQANITTRNFNDTVAQIRKKTGIKDGGHKYLFFTKDLDDNAIIIHCEKV